MQNRPKRRILCNFPFSENQEIPQIPVERSSLQVLLDLFQAFFRFSGLYKVIKSPHLSLLRKLIVRTTIYLEDAITSSLKELLMRMNTLIFIFQHLGFLINIKKSWLKPTSTLKFFGVIKDSMKMTWRLPKEKVLKVMNQRKEIIEREKVTVRETKQIEWEVITHSNSSSSSTLPPSSSSASTYLGIN